MVNRMKDIDSYLSSEHYQYTGQVQHQKKKTWFLLFWDDYNKSPMVVRLLGGQFGTPSGTAQPRTDEQIARIYGAIHHTDVDRWRKGAA